MKKKNELLSFKALFFALILIVGIGFFAIQASNLMAKAAEPRLLTGTIVLSDEMKWTEVGSVNSGPGNSQINTEPFRNFFSFSSGRSLYTFALPEATSCSLVVTACSGVAQYVQDLPLVDPADLAPSNGGVLLYTVARQQGNCTGGGCKYSNFVRDSDTASGVPAIGFGYLTGSTITNGVFDKTLNNPDFGETDYGLKPSCALAYKFDLPMSGVRDGLIGLSISPAVQSVKSINWSSNNTSRWSTTASPSSL
ncbi:MAG: hypothetical protein ABH803_00550, partial [Candidatus Micrarchaeota archaeon]